MKRKITAEKLKEWMVKNWLLVVLGGLGLLVLGVLGIQGLKKLKLSTPIARIEPEDSLKVESSPSRLKSYRRELEEMKSEHFRKKLAMEKIISMDFGAMKVEELGGEVGEAYYLSGGEDSIIQQKIGTPEVSPQSLKPGSKNRGKASNGTVKGPPEKRDPSFLFYIIKPETSAPNNTPPQDASESRFYRVVVDGDQKVFSNSTVNLRLLEEVKMGEHVFPKHSLLHGRLSGGSGGRIKILISSIRAVPLKMRVYDQDYQEGIAYRRDEAVSSSLEEGRDQALDQLLFSVPYGGVFSGVAQAGRRMLQNNRRNKAIFLADGYPLFISFEKGHLK